MADWKRFKDPNVCTHCGREKQNKNIKYCATCRGRMNEGARLHKLAIRDIVLKHYSLTDPPSCECCSETETLFLTIDHINNDGHKERNYGGIFYKSLITRGFPEGLRVLCFNCNCGRARNKGICPHKGLAIRPIVEFKDKKSPGKPAGYILKDKCIICGLPRWLDEDGKGMTSVSLCFQHKNYRKTPRIPAEGRIESDKRFMNNRSPKYLTAKLGRKPKNHAF